MSAAGAVVRGVVSRRLGGLAYDPELAPKWTKEIATEIKDKLKGVRKLNFSILS